MQLIITLAVVHDRFREELTQLGALSQIEVSLEESRLFAYQDGRQPWEDLLAPSQLALNILLRPAIDLESVQPHLLTEDAAEYIQVPRFQQGVAQLVSNTRYAFIAVATMMVTNVPSKDLRAPSPLSL